ncbi:o-succinylbenzoate--CoA ligase [Allokutzneria sp. A3M-2-11 16]|uniref:o-succinylbenzoate--CoA ligase n=1 Tax=Allokutzneria sp. A3M-2-11 16 TaxID=2962043 RepID=UPI0020B78966|nr:o-succinylbenzoate--CoA ligase [Allokutzneria sp. A3M-2-11 16]MCP3798978.1 o-succinylbenzoate--CoA ligase [Allokutzneria sp. A3M-2-11 16]
MRSLVAVSSEEIPERLAAALDGSGPALLPTAPGDPAPPSLTGPVKEEIALVVATSGSTGQPKGVLLSAAALRASASATHARLGGPGTWLLALSAHHIAGVQVLIRSLLAGSDAGIADTSQGFRPDAFASAAHAVLDRPGRHYTSLVPTQLVRLLSDGGAGLEALTGFDGVLLGGAATPAELLEQARAAGVAAITTYGMSETCGGCVYDGVPLDGVRVRLGEDGRISLSGPVLASGYRGAANEAFAEGWFHTNDLGRFEPDGRLTVLGRADDMIITGGVNVAPALVERVLCAEPDVLEACVLGLPHPEWGQLVAAVVVPAEPGAPPSPERLRALVSSQLGGPFAPKRIAVVAALPLRGPGKVDRRALAEMLISHDVISR